MEEKRIQFILKEVLEDEIPSSQIQLWPVVKANLDAGKYKTLQQGEKMNNTKPNRKPRLVFAVAVVVILLVLTLLTPQGRTFAQNILEFFIRTEDTSFQLEASQIVPEQPDPKTVPTAALPADLISVAQAEALVGFDVAELPFVPEGLDYLGVRLYGNTISIEYQTHDQGGHLVIKQSSGGYLQSEKYLQSEWDRVPADAVRHVNIGSADGEFVEGTFVVYPGETSATWNPDAAISRLRWYKDSIWYEMIKFGDVEAIDYLNQAGLIELAENLSIQP